MVRTSPSSSSLPSKQHKGQEFPRLIARVKPRVERQLSAAFDRALAQDGRYGPEVQPLLESARQLTLRGGKRLRAALVVAGEAVVSGSATPTRAALGCGAAMELLQAYFLIHDDWMDRDDKRRGGPSVHHALQQVLGSQHLGACAAILVGDYLAALSGKLLLTATKEHPRRGALMERFFQLQLAAVLGQQLDVIGKQADAEVVYSLKTSSYSVSGPLLLGALLADADRDVLSFLTRYAGPVGIAFQLRDDLLGLFSAATRTGKPQSNDLIAGKRTWTLQYALSHAEPSELRQLNAVVGNTKASPLMVQRALDALERCGAREATEARISELQRGAEAKLRRAPLPTFGKQLLSSAASTLIDRSF
jgi:geranylgeranyl diphosphate synthase, type I